MSDMMKRYIHQMGEFRVATVEVTLAARAAYQQLKPSPIAAHLIAEAMAGTLLSASTLKDAGTLSFHWNGSGPAGDLVMEANSQGDVRGFLGDLQVDFPVHSATRLFDMALGDGNLTVKRQTVANQKLFQSIVPMVQGGLSYNLAYYMLKSEQIPSAVKVGARVDPELGIATAGGVLIQGLPGAKDSLMFILEERVKELGDVAACFAEGDGHHNIIDFIFEGIPLKELETDTVQYRCDCSTKRMFQVISSLPPAELAEMREENKPFEINCNYCKKGYNISVEDLDIIIDMKKSGQM